jgi:molybdenum cofactor cytidylyltransferase
LKACPPHARIVPLINKVESPGQLAAARRLALLLSRIPPREDESENRSGRHAATFAFDAVLLGAVACDTPIREVHTRTVGILLAAGGSSRLGRPKQLLDWRGEPLVSRVVRTALAAGLSEVVVVVGHRAQEVQAVLAGLPVTVAENSEWMQGLSTSIRAGLRAAAPGWGAAIFIQADQPRLTAQVIDRLVKRHRESLAPIVCPGFEGRRGTPTLFDRALAAELETLHGDRGGSVLFAKYQDRIQMIPVTDAAVLDDIDTEDDYERLLGYDQP